MSGRKRGQFGLAGRSTAAILFQYAGLHESLSREAQMKFGLFYEHQVPQPWTAGSELRVFNEIIEQVGLADRLGFDCVWEVEHHFLEEYSHSSAPEIFLAACARETKQIRL